jgi:hypothetical protein
MSTQACMRALLAFGYVMVGCGHTDVHSVTFRPGLPTGGGPCPLYLNGQATPTIGSDVALIQAVGHGSEATAEYVTEELARRGGQLGCDGIVRVQIQQGLSRTHAAGVCVTWLR